MKTMEALLTRRSIRKYTDQQIPEKLINDLLNAAMHAPSARNEQPWHFIVIDRRDILDEIPEFHPYSSMLHQSPVAILVCADESMESLPGYWCQDCAAATENLLLAAHALGLGAVWLGIYPREERMQGMRKLMNTPDHINPFALVALGYPAADLPKVNRYDSSRIHRNQW